MRAPQDSSSPGRGGAQPSGRGETDLDTNSNISAADALHHPTPDLRSDPPPTGEGGRDDRLSRCRRAQARSLRERTTPAERTLWSAIERVPISGTHFRRQVPIGPYVVDFAYFATKLVIELDGPSHTFAASEDKDRRRQTWLEAEGYRVLRFWNQEVRDNVEGVLDTIYAAVHGAIDAEALHITHRRRRRLHPPLEGEGRRRSRRGGVNPAHDTRGGRYVDAGLHPTPDLRSDPTPPGEGVESASMPADGSSFPGGGGSTAKPSGRGENHSDEDGD